MKAGNALKQHYAKWAAGTAKKAVWVVDRLPHWVETIIPWWVALWMLLACGKIAMASRQVRDFPDFAGIFIPYALIGLAPLAAYRLAESAYRGGYRGIEPRWRFTLVGQWLQLDWKEARGHRLFGPAGFIASLLVGLLLNVVFRSGEFLISVPAMTGAAPSWGRSLFLAMAVDVIVMNFLYVACFVMALRTAPLFPRMLAVTWGIDIAMQFTIVRSVEAEGPVPGPVMEALVSLLEGNINKVLISALIWLPYLLLSDRVNVTYRRRLSARE